jgi:hypothetical protein
MGLQVMMIDSRLRIGFVGASSLEEECKKVVSGNIKGQGTESLFSMSNFCFFRRRCKENENEKL